MDISGLGCVRYEALTGEAPYPGATPAAKMYAHRSADPPSVRARRSEVPEALDAVVKRAMAKDPAARYQSRRIRGGGRRIGRNVRAALGHELLLALVLHA